MEALNEILNNGLNTEQAQFDDDYISADGLLYCGKCHTAKQTHLDDKLKPFFGNSDVMQTPCKCEREQVEREEQDRKAKQLEIKRRIFRSEWLPKCFLNIAYRERTFENDNGQTPELIKAARDFVERFNYYQDLHSGLLFSGNVGTGKTYVAACIANELLKRGIKVVFRTENELLREACSDKSEFLHDYLNKASLFILDDFGACIKSEKQAGVIFPYIDDWSASKKPLIITTNLKPADFKETEDTEKARIFSRVIEVCSIPVVVNGKDIRRKISREKYGEFHREGSL